MLCDSMLTYELYTSPAACLTSCQFHLEVRNNAF